MSLEAPTQENQPVKKRKNWLKISIGANIAVVVIAVFFAAGSYVVHLSNTSPQFCGACHLMQANVSSYLTSSNLDHVHQQAGVQCKDCHDYPLSAEIKSGIDFVTGSYTVDKSGALAQRKFDDQLCTKCHISEQHVATLTDFLARNPHDSHNGDLPCSTCHVSHGAQIDYCAECHDNGGQRMIGQPIQPRGTLSGS
jgi:nitrate/TMAO reductase-like tetraheme cytochrome c subunit